MDTAWFRKKMEDRGLTDADIGEALGRKSRSTGSRLIAGIRTMKPHEFAPIAKVLGQPVEEVARRAGVQLSPGSTTDLNQPLTESAPDQTDAIAVREKPMQTPLERLVVLLSDDVIELKKVVRELQDQAGEPPRPRRRGKVS